MKPRAPTLGPGALVGLLIGVLLLAGCGADEVDDPGAAPAAPQEHAPGRPALTLAEMCTELSRRWPARGELPSVRALERLKKRLTELHEQADDSRVEIVAVPALLALNQAIAAKASGSPAATKQALRKGQAQVTAFCQG